MAERVNRKVRVGYVTKNLMDKSGVVSVERRVLHPLYKRVVRKNRNYMFHDEKNECSIGDLIEIMETKPVSKNKKWRLTKIVEKVK